LAFEDEAAAEVADRPASLESGAVAGQVAGVLDAMAYAGRAVVSLGNSQLAGPLVEAALAGGVQPGLALVTKRVRLLHEADDGLAVGVEDNLKLDRFLSAPLGVEVDAVPQPGDGVFRCDALN